MGADASEAVLTVSLAMRMQYLGAIWNSNGYIPFDLYNKTKDQCETLYNLCFFKNF